MIKTTSHEIRKLAQQHFKIENIALKSRADELPSMRFVAMKLCKDFTNENLTSIAKALGLRNHATVLNGLNKFDDYYGQKFFSRFAESYDILHQDIKLLLQERYSEREPLTQEDYKIRLIKIIEKHHSVRKKLEERLRQSELENKNFKKELALLETFV